MNSNDFSMSSGSLTDLFVGRIFYMSSCIARLDFLDTSQSEENGLSAPETSSTKNSFAEHGSVYRVDLRDLFFIIVTHFKGS